MGSLDDRIALVTGAGQGVGRGIALAYAAEGARVVVAGRTLSKCETVAAEIVERGGTATPVACDVTDLADVQRCVATAVETYGGLHILVNNAQTTIRGPLLETTEEGLASLWDSGPLATFRFMKEAHPHLRGDGVIINMASRAGIKPLPVNAVSYGAVKEAIRAMSHGAAAEWATDGIRVYSMLPLATSPALEQMAVDEPAVYDKVLSEIPMRRFGEPETDIGQVAVFLASPAAAYLTGIAIPVDGGAARL